MPRGVNLKTTLMPVALELRAKGWTGVDIAAELGVGVSTVYGWLDDPDLSKQKTRRGRYAGRCTDCGAPTDGSNGYHGAAVRCASCAARHQIENATWNRDAIIAAIRAWVDENGRIPTAADWSPPLAIAHGHHEKAEKFYEDDAWPWTAVVMRRFGSWNAGIRAAGFEPRGRGQRDSEQCIDLDLAREVRARYDAGESSIQLAAAYGIGATTVSSWVRAAGGRMRPRGRPQLLRYAR